MQVGSGEVKERNDTTPLAVYVTLWIIQKSDMPLSLFM